jgi:hypothetical protein
VESDLTRAEVINTIGQPNSFHERVPIPALTGSRFVTAGCVLITKLRRLLPPLRIEARWGRGYVTSGIVSSSPRGTPQAEAAAKRHAEPAPPQPDKPRNSFALTPSAITQARTAIRRTLVEISDPGVREATAPPAGPNGCRVDELTAIERFRAERGVTRCPDVATMQLAPLPPLVWGKKTRRWVRPPTAAGEAS